MDLMTEISKNAQPILRDILLKAAVKGELINTNDYVRGIGKTTSLILFAKEFGFNVLVNHRSTAKYLREKSDYDFIYASDEVYLPEGKYVVDEMIRNFPSEKPLDIVTGYRYVNL